MVHACACFCECRGARPARPRSAGKFGRKWRKALAFGTKRKDERLRSTTARAHRALPRPRMPHRAHYTALRTRAHSCTTRSLRTLRACARLTATAGAAAAAGGARRPTSGSCAQVHALRGRQGSRCVVGTPTSGSCPCAGAPGPCIPQRSVTAAASKRTYACRKKQSSEQRVRGCTSSCDVSPWPRGASPSRVASAE